MQNRSIRVMIPLNFVIILPRIFVISSARWFKQLEPAVFLVIIVALRAPKSMSTSCIYLIYSDIADSLVEFNLVLAFYANFISYSALFLSDSIVPNDDSTISPLFFQFSLIFLSADNPPPSTFISSIFFFYLFSSSSVQLTAIFYQYLAYKVELKYFRNSSLFLSLNFITKFLGYIGRFGSCDSSRTFKENSLSHLGCSSVLCKFIVKFGE